MPKIDVYCYRCSKWLGDFTVEDGDSIDVTCSECERTDREAGYEDGYYDGKTDERRNSEF